MTKDPGSVLTNTVHSAYVVTRPAVIVVRMKHKKWSRHEILNTMNYASFILTIECSLKIQFNFYFVKMRILTLGVLTISFVHAEKERFIAVRPGN